jgi:TM2 domain-containing membrane protein YozV
MSTVDPTSTKTCPSCGTPNPLNAEVCSRCGFSFGAGIGAPPNFAPVSIPSDVSGKKMAAGLCGIFLGSLGIHKFVLGYTTAGIIMLLVSVLSCGIAAVVMQVIGIVEGVLYLTKSDQQFYNEYILGKKEWF